MNYIDKMFLAFVLFVIIVVAVSKYALALL
jgi:hypothetical protein